MEPPWWTFSSDKVNPRRSIAPMEGVSGEEDERSKITNFNSKNSQPKLNSNGALNPTPKDPISYKAVNILKDPSPNPRRVMDPKLMDSATRTFSRNADPTLKDTTFYKTVKRLEVPSPDPNRVMDPNSIERTGSSDDSCENKRRKFIPGKPKALPKTQDPEPPSSTPADVPWTADEIISALKRKNHPDASRESSDPSRNSGKVIPDDPGLRDRQSLLDSINMRKADSQDSFPKCENVSGSVSDRRDNDRTGNAKNSQRNSSSFDRPNLRRFYHHDSGNGSSEETNPWLSRDFTKYPGGFRNTLPGNGSTEKRNHSSSRDFIKNRGGFRDALPGNGSNEERNPSSSRDFTKNPVGFRNTLPGNGSTEKRNPSSSRDFTKNHGGFRDALSGDVSNEERNPASSSRDFTKYPGGFRDTFPGNDSIEERNPSSSRNFTKHLGGFRDTFPGNVSIEERNHSSSRDFTKNRGGFRDALSGDVSNEERNPSSSRDFTKNPVGFRDALPGNGSNEERNPSPSRDFTKYPGGFRDTLPGNVSNEEKNNNTNHSRDASMFRNVNPERSQTNTRTNCPHQEKANSPSSSRKKNVYTTSSFSRNCSFPKDFNPGFSNHNRSEHDSCENRKTVNDDISLFSRNESILSSANSGMYNLNISGNVLSENRMDNDKIESIIVLDKVLSKVYANKPSNVLDEKQKKTNDMNSKDSSIPKGPHLEMSFCNIQISCEETVITKDSNPSSSTIFLNENTTSVSFSIHPSSLKKPQPIKFHPYKSENTSSRDRHQNPGIVHSKPAGTEGKVNPVIVWSDIAVNVVKKPETRHSFLPNKPEEGIVSIKMEPKGCSNDVQQSSLDLSMHGSIINDTDYPESDSPTLTNVTLVMDLPKDGSQVITDPDSGKTNANMDECLDLSTHGSIINDRDYPESESPTLTNVTLVMDLPNDGSQVYTDPDSGKTYADLDKSLDLTMRGSVINDTNYPENVPSVSPAFMDVTQVINLPNDEPRIFTDPDSGKTNADMDKSLNLTMHRFIRNDTNYPGNVQSVSPDLPKDKSYIFTDPESGKTYANMDKFLNLDDSKRIQLKKSGSEQFGLQESTGDQISFSRNGLNSPGSTSSFIFDHIYDGDRQDMLRSVESPMDIVPEVPEDMQHIQGERSPAVVDYPNISKSNETFQNAQNQVWDQTSDHPIMSQVSISPQGNILENVGSFAQTNVGSFRQDQTWDYPNMSQCNIPDSSQENMGSVGQRGRGVYGSKWDYLNMSQSHATRDSLSHKDIDISSSQHSHRNGSGVQNLGYLNMSQYHAKKNVSLQKDMNIHDSQQAQRNISGVQNWDYLNMSKSHASREILSQKDMDIDNSQHAQRNVSGVQNWDYLHMSQSHAPKDISPQKDMDIDSSHHTHRNRSSVQNFDYLNLSQSHAPKNISPQKNMDINNSRHVQRKVSGVQNWNCLNLSQSHAPRDIQNDINIGYSQHAQRNVSGVQNWECLNLSQSYAPRDIQKDMNIANFQHADVSGVQNWDYLKMSQSHASRDFSAQKNMNTDNFQHAHRNVSGVQNLNSLTSPKFNGRRENSYQEDAFENFYRVNVVNDSQCYSFSVNRDEDEVFKSQMTEIYNLRSRSIKDIRRSDLNWDSSGRIQKKKRITTKTKICRIQRSREACRTLLSNNLLNRILRVNYDRCRRAKPSKSVPKPERSLRIFKRNGFKIFKLDRIRSKIPKQAHLSIEELCEDLSQENGANFDAFSFRSVSTERSFEPDDGEDVIPGDPPERLSQVDRKLRRELDEVLRDKSLLPSQAYSEDPEEDVKRKIQDLLLKIYDDLQRGRAPVLTYRRPVANNCVLRDGRLQFKNDPLLGKHDTYRKNARTFKTIVYVLKAVVDLIDNGFKMNKREMYYMLKHLVKNCGELYRALHIVCMTLDVGMWSLNIFAQKGLVYGNMKLVLGQGEIVNCNVPGTLIPMDVDDIVEIHTKAAFILVVEKAAIFHKLIEEGLPTKLTRPFVLITGKGFPDQSTQRFLRKMWLIMSVPVFILVDADPHGIGIMMNYRFGSVSNAHISHHLAVPSAVWLGVFPSEFRKYEAITQKMTATEERYIETLLKFPNLSEHPRLLRELTLLRNQKVKASIEGLLKSDVFLSEVYLPTKFYCRDFV